MTSDKKDFINAKINEINDNLKDVSLSDFQREILVKERSYYETQANELNDSGVIDADNDNDNDDEESDCVVIEEEYSEESDTEYESVYFKYCFEHCTNIDDIIHTLESLKSYFEELKSEGHELTQPVDSGYCFIDKVYASEK
jgi:hypothetical protein